MHPIPAAAAPFPVKYRQHRHAATQACSCACFLGLGSVPVLAVDRGFAREIHTSASAVFLRPSCPQSWFMAVRFACAGGSKTAGPRR